MAMNDDKKERIIRLVCDDEMMHLLHLATTNWKIAVERMNQVKQERVEGINDDYGMEVMAVFVRMRRVYGYMLALSLCPQAHLLPSVTKSLRPFIDNGIPYEHEMDEELVQQMVRFGKQPEVNIPYYWTKPKVKQADFPDLNQHVEKLSTQMVAKYILPHLNAEDMMAVTKTMSNMSLKIDDNDDEYFELSWILPGIAVGNYRKMAIGLLARHTFVETIYNRLSMQESDDAKVASMFEQAKEQLLKSEGWRDYWFNHKRQLERKGSIDEQWKEDADEVEQWLENAHGYLYNSSSESPEVFGQALKRERLDDESMLLLLFHLAKKEAIARELEKPDERRNAMESKVKETALKLRELAAEEYYDNYETIWKRIVESEHLSEQLMNYNASKYNNGFNMLCFCKIIGHLNREHKFFGSHSPEDMGKVLGDKYRKISYGTFANYIKKKATMLNKQSINELEEILKNQQKENSKT